MTEPKAIVADPASDGSEESWILLDEMDEAMNEDYESSPNNSTEEKGDQSTSTETWNEPNFGEVAKGVITATEENTDHSNVEAISSEEIDVCPSNDEDDDDSDDTAHLRRLVFLFYSFLLSKDIDLKLSPVLAPNLNIKSNKHFSNR